MKKALFFGSFNPPHIGHLIMANTLTETTDIDKVVFVVTPQNPFKSKTSLAHEFDRIDMVRATIFDNSNLEVSDIEFSLPQPNYTIHTLLHLQEKFPNDTFVLFIGEDNLSSFHKWKNYLQILDQFEVYVYPRPNTQSCDLKNHPQVKLIALPQIEISATFIREAIKKNQSIRYLVTPEVQTLIESRKLYL